MNAQERYQIWLDKLEEQDPMRQELLQMAGSAETIEDCFYREIEFGTAGLRGICGAGCNRMNRFTVGRATQGIAEYILESGLDPERGVVIAYDCRYHSREFSELAAEILAGNGIRAWLFPDMRPTPEMSFAIRRLGAVSGINMTASHNPKEYNGYKVYWEDGAQISGQVSDGMLKKILAHDLFDEFPRMPLQDAVEEGLCCMLDLDMDDAYLEFVESMAMRPDEELDLAVPIVYTPLNGAGFIPVSRVMRNRGFSAFRVVKEQSEPDPEFTTVGYPNPEDPKAFALAEKLGKECGAEVLIATDPDSDRMAVEILDKSGSYRFLNGNQTGAMLIAYMAESMKKAGELDGKQAMIKSIVTGDMGAVICRDYGIEVFESLTGFKNICGRIPPLEKEGYQCFFAYEESIGCAPSAEVRDKDGICAAMLVAEMAAYYRKKGMSLQDALEELYRKYGYFAEKQISIVLQGAAGAARIGRIMDYFRKEKPEQFGTRKVEKIIDYIDGYEDIPASNVMKYIFTDGSWFAMRPSGTEPKIKFYYYAVSDKPEISAAAVDEMVQAVQNMADSVE